MTTLFIISPHCMHSQIRPIVIDVARSVVCLVCVAHTGESCKNG